MATPQTGIGSSITVGGTALAVRDFSIAFAREHIKSSELTHYYDTSIVGRISATISANVIVDSASANAFTTAVQSQTALSSTVTFALVDKGGLNTYSGSAYCTGATHTFTGEDVDIIALELQVTGTIA